MVKQMFYLHGPIYPQSEEPVSTISLHNFYNIWNDDFEHVLCNSVRMTNVQTYSRASLIFYYYLLYAHRNNFKKKPRYQAESESLYQVNNYTYWFLHLSLIHTEKQPTMFSGKITALPIPYTEPPTDKRFALTALFYWNNAFVCCFLVGPSQLSPPLWPQPKPNKSRLWRMKSYLFSSLPSVLQKTHFLSASLLFSLYPFSDFNGVSRNHVRQKKLTTTKGLHFMLMRTRTDSCCNCGEWQEFQYGRISIGPNQLLFPIRCCCVHTAVAR